MTYAIDAPTLEAAIVRQCSPTLAGLKPAGLFTFPGPFATEDVGEQAQIALRRSALQAAYQRDGRLSPLAVCTG